MKTVERADSRKWDSSLSCYDPWRTTIMVLLAVMVSFHCSPESGKIKKWEQEKTVTCELLRRISDIWQKMYHRSVYLLMENNIFPTEHKLFKQSMSKQPVCTLHLVHNVDLPPAFTVTVRSETLQYGGELSLTAAVNPSANTNHLWTTWPIDDLTSPDDSVLAVTQRLLIVIPPPFSGHHNHFVAG